MISVRNWSFAEPAWTLCRKFRRRAEPSARLVLDLFGVLSGELVNSMTEEPLSTISRTPVMRRAMSGEGGTKAGPAALALSAVSTTAGGGVGGIPGITVTSPAPKSCHMFRKPARRTVPWSTVKVPWSPLTR